MQLPCKRLILQQHVTNVAIFNVISTEELIPLIEGPEGKNGNWDLPIFALGKWDLGHWDWESQTQNWEWETCLEITQHM